MIANKLRNNNELENNQGPARKLTSLMSLFQQKDDVPIQPINKVVINKTPVKKWAPVSTPHLQRTVRPETKNFDFYSKVKKAKSKDFKRAESLRKSKSKLNCDNTLNTSIDLNNNNSGQNQRIELIKQSTTAANKIQATPLAPPPPPPLPLQIAKPTNSTIINKSILNNKPKSTSVSIAPTPTPIPPPPPPPINQQKSNKIAINNNSTSNNKVSSPTISSIASRTPSPQPSSNASSRVSSPQTNNSSALINKSTAIPASSNQLNKQLNNGLPANKTLNTQLSQTKLDPTKLNKFNKPNEQNTLLNDKCVDYCFKLNKKPIEPQLVTQAVVRNIPIKIETKEIEKEVKEEIIELEVEEEIEESSENEESEEESEEEESEEGKLIKYYYSL